MWPSAEDTIEPAQEPAQEEPGHDASGG
jgi:hypothetical protein